MNFEELLKSSPDKDTRVVIAEHSDCPLHILKIIASNDISIEVIQSILKNKNLSNEISDIAQNRLKYLTDPNNEKKVWIDLLNSANHKLDRIDIVSRIDCPNWVLEIIIKNDVDADVVTAAMDNISCSQELKSIGLNRIPSLHKETKIPETLCPIPWNHLQIEQNGDLRICCLNIYEPFGKLEKNGELANIKNTTLDEARNLPMIKELRKSMVNNEKHSLCKLCWDNEKLGLSSKRIMMNKEYNNFSWNLEKDDGTINTTHFPLRYMDIRFGNLCNLTCRSCGPKDSSLWLEDYLTLRETNSATLIFYNRKKYEVARINNKAQIINDADDFLWYEQDKFWNEIENHYCHIDRLYFTGGEPTINKTHFKLLEYLIASGFSKNIYLEYNSNMVAVPEKLYDYWKQFKGVGIGCSIDGIYEYANYIRPPSKWETLEINLDYLGYSKISNLQASISTTVSVFNVLHFLEIAKWLESKQYSNISSIPNFHMLEGPRFLNVKILPDETKNFIKEEYEKFYEEIEVSKGKIKSQIYKNYFSGIVTHMFSEKTDITMLRKLKNTTEKIDKIKEQSLKQTIPWLFDILNSI